MVKERSWQWLCIYLLSSALLLWPAILNGYPLLFSDSASYVAMGSRFAIAYDRAMTYGLVIAPLHKIGGLWAVAVVQALFMTWLLKRVLDVALTTCRPVHLLIASLVLAVSSSLPWFAGQIMPDLFAPVICLMLYMLIFGRDCLHRVERWLVPILLAGIIAFHLSFLPLAGLLVFVAGLVAWRRRQWRAARLGVLHGTVALLAAFTMLSSINLLVDGRFKPSLMSDTFLLARLLDAGLAQQPLASACRRQPLGLCALLPQIAPSADLRLFRGKPGQYYLWDVRSPRTPLQKLNWRKIRDEESAIVGATIAQYPAGVIRLAIKSFGQQIVTAHSADGMFRCIECQPIINNDLPRDLPAMLASRQQHDRLQALAVIDDRVIALIALISLAPMLIVLADPPVDVDRVLPLAVMTLFALLGNAAVTGILSSVADRYQSRILWLLPFCAVIAALRLMEMRRKSQGRGSTPAELHI